jgi:hypothetical protein
MGKSLTPTAEQMPFVLACAEAQRLGLVAVSQQDTTPVRHEGTEVAFSVRYCQDTTGAGRAVQARAHQPQSANIGPKANTYYPKVLWYPAGFTHRLVP